ncbi:hypothetical protein [Paenibacillus sp. HB172176]|uniref:hypothetical protein n=1 Tax=Paenibacillus sp. HB172176 TaxID=2493690 RepID=UPI00143A41C0|nr:hypothetical protein [Paenibacillus sp. HB172176]
MEKNKVNYSVKHSGAFSNFGEVTEGMLKGKIFLKEALGLTGMEVSLNNLPPNGEVGGKKPKSNKNERPNKQRHVGFIFRDV